MRERWRRGREEEEKEEEVEEGGNEGQVEKGESERGKRGGRGEAEVSLTIIVLFLNSSMMHDLPTSCPAPLQRQICQWKG